MVVRASALLALLADLVVYYAVVESLPDIPVWWDVAVISLLVIPATFALIWLALPARTSRLLPAAVLVLAGATALAELGDFAIAANFLKLATVAGAAWFFLRFFEEASWVLLVALLIVPVDIYSVARGPTRTIIEEKPEIFDRLSVYFPSPGDGGAAQLGLPDVLFFALFVGAAVQFGLRPGLTWILCTLSLGLPLALTVAFDTSGLPALPFISAGFVLANADRLWHSVRRRPAT
jgi:hypothetical protein